MRDRCPSMSRAASRSTSKRVCATECVCCIHASPRVRCFAHGIPFRYVPVLLARCSSRTRSSLEKVGREITGQKAVRPPLLFFSTHAHDACDVYTDGEHGNFRSFLLYLTYVQGAELVDTITVGFTKLLRVFRFSHYSSRMF
jgi:hypothetical protein